MIQNCVYGSLAQCCSIFLIKRIIISIGAIDQREQESEEDGWERGRGRVAINLYITSSTVSDAGDSDQQTLCLCAVVSVVAGMES